MKIATVIVLLLLVSLVACTGALSPSSAAAPTSSQAPASGPSPVSNAPTGKPGLGLETGAVIVLKRSGGFAGKTEEWTIYADGRVTTNTSNAGQVSPAELATLLQTIDQLGFYSLPGSYMPLNTCCDRVTYELSVSDAGKSNQVTFLEGAPKVPASLWQITDAVTLLATKSIK